MPIEGKVAEVLDQYRVVANVGSDDGVEEGMEFEIYIEEGGYTDPDTGEDLGTRRVEKGRVQVVEVYEKMSVLESSETTYSSPLPSLVTGSTSKKKLPTEGSVESNEKIVNRGDNIIQLV